MGTSPVVFALKIHAPLDSRGVHLEKALVLLFVFGASGNAHFASVTPKREVRWCGWIRSNHRLNAASVDHSKESIRIRA